MAFRRARLNSKALAGIPAGKDATRENEHRCSVDEKGLELNKATKVMRCGD